MSNRWLSPCRLLSAGLALLLATTSVSAGSIVFHRFTVFTCHKRAPWYTYFPMPSQEYTIPQAGPYYPNWPQAWPPAANTVQQSFGAVSSPFLPWPHESGLPQAPVPYYWYGR